ncbi:MAG: class GN sortase, partial [Halieaceae bacterium]|nr:class GN sortase [Halieaceae bacterium]
MRVLAIPALVLALSQLGPALWLELKATLAQQLIAAAWRAPGEARPWPWADTFPLARLDLPAQQASLYVLAGGQGHALAFGPAHDSRSSLPGTRGMTVIAGHRDTHFAVLEQVALGDALQLTDKTGLTHHYRVTDMQVVDSRRQPLQLSGDGLALVTCFPF